MIHVSHHSNYGWAINQIFFIIRVRFGCYSFLKFYAYKLNFIIKFAGNQSNGFSVKTLIDRYK